MTTADRLCAAAADLITLAADLREADDVVYGLGYVAAYADPALAVAADLLTLANDHGGTP